MGDPANDVTREAPRRSACRSVCLGFGLFFLVGLGALLILNGRAATRLGARVDALKDDMAALRRSAGDGTRPVLWGAPVAGNAVDDYNALEWVLGPREDWKTTPPPGLPRTDLPMGGADGLARRNQWTGQVELDYLSAVGNVLAVVGAGSHPERPVTARPDAAAIVSALLPLTRHVREGLRRERCDWQVELERGAAAPIPNLIALRTGANLMVIEAQRASPDDAARIGLELVAFGQDVGRSPLLISKMISVAIKCIGLKSLERTLLRPLSREAYAGVVATLGRIDPVTLVDAIESERLGMSAEVARMWGRPLAGTPAPDAALIEGVPTFALFLEREWEGLELGHRLLADQMTAPYAAQAAKQAELDAFLEGSWYMFARIALPNVAEARVHVDEANALQAAVRVLAAAHLHRLDRQAFPERIEDLQAALGGALPADPFRDGAGPLTLRLVDGELRCYAWFRDGDDDQGAQHSGDDRTGDFGAGTRAPP